MVTQNVDDLTITKRYNECIPFCLAWATHAPTAAILRTVGSSCCGHLFKQPLSNQETTAFTTKSFPFLLTIDSLHLLSFLTYEVHMQETPALLPFATPFQRKCQALAASKENCYQLLKTTLHCTKKLKGLFDVCVITKRLLRKLLTSWRLRSWSWLNHELNISLGSWVAVVHEDGAAHVGTIGQLGNHLLMFAALRVAVESKPGHPTSLNLFPQKGIKKCCA